MSEVPSLLYFSHFGKEVNPKNANLFATFFREPVNRGVAFLLPWCQVLYRIQETGRF